MTKPTHDTDNGIIDEAHFKEVMADFDAYEAGDTSRLLIHHVYVCMPIHYTGDEIYAIRLKAHLTFEAMAYIMGVETSTVISWENGDTQPDGLVCQLLTLIDENADD